MDDRQPIPDVPAKTPSVNGQPPPDLPAGTVVVTMPDELDHINAPQIRQELAAAFGPGVTTVIADFTPTMFCDSSGAAELVLAHKLAAATSAVFRVVVPRGYLENYLARVGLVAYLSIHSSLIDALRAGVRPQEPDDGVLTG